MIIMPNSTSMMVKAVMMMMEATEGVETTKGNLP